MTQIPETATSRGSALDALYWRAEILQAMFWMRGEGLAQEVTPQALAKFLVADNETVADQARRLAEDGYLRAGTAGAYALTALGVAEGGRSFHDEFAELTRPAHGDCGPACWCRDPDHIGEPCPSDPKHVPIPAPEPPRPTPGPEQMRHAS